MSFRKTLDEYYDYRPLRSLLLNKFIGNGSKVLNLFANIILPMDFRLTPIKNNMPIAQGPIISITSFPKRINKLWIVIECLLRQTIRAEKIVLYLSKEQFNDITRLPQKLRDYESKNLLDIKLVDGDIRSYKKFWYAIKEFPDKRIITVDDDLLYSPTLIERMLHAADDNPDCVIGNYCSWIGRDKKGNVKPYSKWPHKDVKIGDKSSDIFFGSGGGTLFPVGSLEGADQPIEEIREVCHFADDIWLNAWVRKNKYKVMNIHREAAIPNIINWHDQKLSSVNNGQGLNDKQLFAVIEYFKKKFGMNPFAL